MIVGSMFAIPAYPNILSDNPIRGLLKNWSAMGPYGLLISLALLYPAMALVAKRLHDRNKTAWLAGLVWAPAVVQTIANLVGWTPMLQQIHSWGTWILGYFVALGLWFAIELGFYGGTSGPNRYGPESGSD